MRTLRDHKVNGLNEALEICVMDQPGAGGACHRYDISGFETDQNPSAIVSGYRSSFGRTIIMFQNGPIKEVGVNGISQEALLAIVIDRLRSFQAGPYACDENEAALLNLERALGILHSRTKARVERGVEGTNVV